MKTATAKIFALALALIMAFALVPVATPPPVYAAGLTGATAYAGADHVLFIKPNGDLYGWGGNDVGQLGDGTRTNRTTPVYIMSDVASVQHGRAIKTDGSLWAWGDNTYGELGDGTTTARLKPVKIMDGVACVCDSGGTVVKTDGTVWDMKRSDGRADNGTPGPRAYYKREGIDNGACVDGDLILTKDGSLWSL
jgi:hypothetical protein